MGGHKWKETLVAAFFWMCKYIDTDLANEQNASATFGFEKSVPEVKNWKQYVAANQELLYISEGGLSDC